MSRFPHVEQALDARPLSDLIAACTPKRIFDARRLNEALDRMAPKDRSLDRITWYDVADRTPGPLFDADLLNEALDRLDWRLWGMTRDEIEDEIPQLSELWLVSDQAMKLIFRHLARGGNSRRRNWDKEDRDYRILAAVEAAKEGLVEATQIDTQREIARVLGMNLETVKSAARTARRRRERIEEEARKNGEPSPWVGYSWMTLGEGSLILV
ncbi:MAG: hypothetical protein OXD36_02000 [Rhodobacter sp.]|nr:hypothetical protein [Rhodobacter sp.]